MILIILLRFDKKVNGNSVVYYLPVPGNFLILSLRNLDL